MQLYTVDLYEQIALPKAGEGGTLTVFAPRENGELEKKRRPMALVVPGGGYAMVSEREGEPVALRLLAEGFVVGVLSYSVQKSFPVPFVEAAMAAAYLREHAEELGGSERLCVFGFSAGGHLAGMLSVLQRDPALSILKEHLPFARPDAAVLCYPVVTLGGFTHAGTAEVISGGEEGLRARLSLENAVKRDAVPAFLWHTVEDAAVPVENTLLLAAAYRRAKVPFELHLFERGVHGLALADGETANGRDAFFNEEAQAWLPLALAWLRLRGFAVR